MVLTKVVVSNINYPMGCTDQQKPPTEVEALWCLLKLEDEKPRWAVRTTQTAEEVEALRCLLKLEEVKPRWVVRTTQTAEEVEALWCLLKLEEVKP